MFLKLDSFSMCLFLLELLSLLIFLCFPPLICQGVLGVFVVSALYCMYHRSFLLPGFCVCADALTNSGVLGLSACLRVPCPSLATFTRLSHLFFAALMGI